MSDLNNGDMPANSIFDSMGDTCETDCYSGSGLTKREHFAGLAMQGLLAQSNGSAISSDCSIGAKYCVDMADALLKQLEQG